MYQLKFFQTFRGPENYNLLYSYIYTNAVQEVAILAF